jgi:DNA-binding transcriptional LysR family regulator
MDRFFHEAQISPPFVMELPCNESIKQSVIANMGLAFLSLHTAQLELAAGTLVALDVVGLPLVRWWHVVSLRSRAMSDAAESLRGFISQFGNVFITGQFDGTHDKIHGPAAAVVEQTH